METINPEHLPAVVSALRADDVAYLNVGDGLRREPPEWRALADATCETCVFDGPLSLAGRHPTMMAPCPDCRGTGKPIHTLACSKCEVVPDHWCPDCVHVVVADLVPVMSIWNGHDACIITDESGRWHYWSRTQPSNSWSTPGPITPLGKPLTPGDWGAVLRPAGGAT